MTATVTCGPLAVVVRPNGAMVHGLRSCMPDAYQEPVDVDAAEREAEELIEVLRREGVEVIDLVAEDSEFADESADLADRVFPEDWLLCHSRELCIGAQMALDPRFREPAVGSRALIRLGLLEPQSYRCVADEDPEARFEVGDQSRFFRDDGTVILMVAESSRTNDKGITAVERIVRQQYNGSVVIVPNKLREPSRCLHWTSGSGVLGPMTALVDPRFIDPAPFLMQGIAVVEIDEHDSGEMNAANCLWLPTTGRVLMDIRFPRTIRRVEQQGFEVIPVQNKEHGKIAGGLTCRSNRFHWTPQANARRNGTVK